MSNNINKYKATTVDECWLIAFSFAEECQEKMNLEPFNYYHKWKNKRDAASEIAHRIKYGEEPEIE